MKKIWLLFIRLFIIFFASNFSFAKDYEYSNYDITADIFIDWSMNVNEKITTNFFVQKHGIFRSIPLNYSTEWIDFHIDVSNINVKWKKFSTSNANWETEIKIWDANISLIWEQNYTISYTTYGLIRNFSWLWYAELYWNLVGYDFDTNINKVHAIINLPKFYSWFTSDDFLITTDWKTTSVWEFQWTLDRSQWDIIIIDYDKTLPAFQWITLAIKFPNDYFEFDHSKQESLLWVVQPWTSGKWSTSVEKWTNKKSFSIIGTIKNILWLLLIPLIILFVLCPPLGMLLLYILLYILFKIVIQTIRRTGLKIRSKRGWWLIWKLSRKFPVVVQYAPPANISAAEASLLIHRHAEPIALMSLIYKRAAEWLISIKADKSEGSWDNQKEIKYITIKKVWEIDELAPYYEKNFFESLLDTQTIPTNKNIKFLKSLLPIWRNSANITIDSQDLEALELYWKKKKWFTAINIEKYLRILLLTLFFILFVLIILFSALWWWSVRIFILLTVLIFATALHSSTYNKITQSWAEVLSQVLWYRKFLQKCDENQLRLLLKENPLFVNNMLSYATIFGIESELIKKIMPIMDELNINISWYNSDLYDINNLTSSLRNNTSPKSSPSWLKWISLWGGWSYSSDGWFSGWSSFWSSSSSSSRSGWGWGFSRWWWGGWGGWRSW